MGRQRATAPNMFLPIVYHILWRLLHAIVHIVSVCTALALYFGGQLDALRASKTFRTLAETAKDDKRAIERSKKHLTKLPVHIAVIVGGSGGEGDHSKPPSLRTLSKLIAWSAAAGVRCISFYDYKGTPRLCFFHNKRNELQHTGKN